MGKNKTRSKNSYLDPASKKEERWDKADPGQSSTNSTSNNRSNSNKKKGRQKKRK